jgi:hypothetical protein
MSSLEVRGKVSGERGTEQLNRSFAQNPNDKTHGSFFQILPTPRPYARFPFYNMMNNEDFYGTVVLRLPHSVASCTLCVWQTRRISGMPAEALSNRRLLATPAGQVAAIAAWRMSGT